MPDWPPDDATLVAVAARLLDAPPAAMRVVERSDRLYSRLLTVEAAGKRHVVKSAAGSIRRQYEAHRRANEAVDLPGFRRLALRYDAETNVLVMEHAGGSTLAAALGFAALAGGPRARGQLAAHCRLAGMWLRAYHDTDLGRGDCSEAAQVYLLKRAPALHRLVSPNLVARLSAFAALRDAETAPSHGDFKPQHVLVDPDGGIAVIDFTIGEWERMAPAWDAITFLVGLERVVRRSPLRTLIYPAAGRDLLHRAFREGYGEDGLAGPAFETLRCLRHLGFLAAYARRSRSALPVARWHQAQALEAFAASGL